MAWLTVIEAKRSDSLYEILEDKHGDFLAKIRKTDHLFKVIEAKHPDFDTNDAVYFITVQIGQQKSADLLQGFAYGLDTKYRNEKTYR